MVTGSTINSSNLATGPDLQNLIPNYTHSTVWISTLSEPRPNSQFPGNQTNLARIVAKELIVWAIIETEKISILK